LSHIISQLKIKGLQVCSGWQFLISAVILLLTHGVQLKAEHAHKIYKFVHSHGAVQWLMM